MHGRPVQQILGVFDTKESRRLLERLLAETFNFPKLGTRPEQAVVIAIRNDVLSKLVADTRNVFQQIDRCGIEIHADAVHTRFHNRRKAFLQFLLIDIVLILADADRFRIRLHQFGQRILQPARNRNRAAHRDIQFGKFFARALGGRVDRGTRFADDDHKHVELVLFNNRANERVGLFPWR